MLEKDKTASTFWVLKRMVGTLLLLLIFALSVFGLHEIFDMPGRGVTISVSLLFGLPFALGAIAAFLNNPAGRKPRIPNGVSGPLFAICVLIIGGIVIREGVICMVILAPLWLLSAALGSGLVGSFHDQFRQRSKLNCSILVGLPFFVLFAESYIPQRPQDFTVERSIIISAPASEIWETLITLDEIDDSEGKWNFTQSVLGIPRPKSAVIAGEGENAIRYAQWGDHITFEEHVSLWQFGTKMTWNFVFPNSSIQEYTDRHISPDGLHLKIVEGGYELTDAGSGKTKLTLTTRYAARTPANTYSSLWGELILGDIQSNVLHIVRDRSEA